jgi:type VI secretion system protein ImpM
MVRTKGVLAMPAENRSFSDVFTAMRSADHADVYAAATFWWTIGGEGFAPLALGGKGMPDPFLFADMLVGKLATESIFAPTA